MEYKVLLDCGQSGCNGESDIIEYSAAQLTEKTKFLTWYNGVATQFKGGVNNRNRSVSEQKGGYDIELATQIEDNYNGRVIRIKVAEGGIGTYAGQPWNSGITSWFSGMLTQFELQIDLFEKFFALNFPDDTFVYSLMIWNQGEQDGTSEANSLAYETNCGATWDAIKTKISKPNLPIYDFKLSDLTNVTWKANINIAKVALRTAYANGADLYDTDASDGYSFQDTVHYDSATYTFAGLNLYNSIIANGHL